MRYVYTAVIEKNTDNNNAHVSFPCLHYECDISFLDDSDLMSKLPEELGFALWLLENAGKKFPQNNSAVDKNLSPNVTWRLIECDYETFRQSLSVRNINLF